MRISLIKVSLEVCVSNFVSRLILPIKLGFFLNGVVRQMYNLVRKIVKIIFLAACPNIAFFIPISFYYSIDTCYKYIMPKIKFSTVVEKRFQILLNDVSFLLSIFMNLSSSDQSGNFIKRSDIYPVPSVCIFPRFNNPYPVRFVSFTFKESLKWKVVNFTRSNMISFW